MSLSIAKLDYYLEIVSQISYYRSRINDSSLSKADREESEKELTRCQNVLDSMKNDWFIN